MPEAWLACFCVGVAWGGFLGEWVVRVCDASFHAFEELVASVALARVCMHLLVVFRAGAEAGMRVGGHRVEGA